MKKNNVITSLLLIFASSVLVSKLSVAAESNNTWSSQAELGFVNTSGNTETSTINAKLSSKTEREKWRHALNVEALNSSNAGISSAEKYLASAQSDFKFNVTDYMYGLGSYEKDLFSGYDYQVTLSAGYGRRVFADETMTFDLEIGPGLRSQKDKVTDSTVTDPLLHLAAKYKWKISPTSSLSEELTADLAEDLDVIKSVTSLKAKINSSLAMSVTYTFKDSSVVPVGTKNTDTEAAVTLVYSF